MNENNPYNYISPSFLVDLIEQIEEKLWSKYERKKYERVNQFINFCHEDNGETGWGYSENFTIYYKDEVKSQIDLGKTLATMPGDVLIKIAIELGIDTPGYLPSIPTFRNILKDSNENAYKTFTRALKNVDENPDEAISLANSALEGLLKNILKDPVFGEITYSTKDTLYDLAIKVLKAFKMYPQKDHEIEEVSSIGSGLLTATKYIEDIRSAKTSVHGKAKDEYLISNPLWARYVINSVTTVGLMLSEYHNSKYPAQIEGLDEMNDQPINIDDIPF